MNITITPLGTAMILLEIGTLRLLTDPVFDPPGGHYNFGWGTGSQKLTAPALTEDALGHIDAVLLSHDHHDDNLDQRGRAFLPRVSKVITTAAGERRLKGNAIGLHPWESTELISADGLRVRITATPAQHGPFFARPLVGMVIGFILEWEGQQHGAVYISGDTIWFRGIPEIARRFNIGTAILHLGGVRFPLYGPIRFTFSGSEAARTARLLAPHTVIPIHYEGWKHFREKQTTSEQAFKTSGVAGRVRWLPLGVPAEIEV